jgi:hypothetical protein
MGAGERPPPAGGVSLAAGGAASALQHRRACDMRRVLRAFAALRRRHAMMAWLGYLGLSVALTYPVALGLATHIPIAHQIPGWMPGDGDPWHSLWMLWFADVSLFERGTLPFATELLFFPRGADLSYFALVILPLLIALPLVRLVGVVATYNLLIILSLAAAGYAAFRLVDRLVQDKRAAFLAGMVFAFCPYHMGRAVEHLFLVMGAVWLPLYALLLIKAVQRGKARDLLWAPVCFLLTLLSNPYYAVFLVLFSLLYGVFWLWQADAGELRRARLRRLLLLAALSGGLSLPAAWLLFARPWTDTQLHVPLADATPWGADLIAYVLPNPYHPLWGAAVRPIYEGLQGNIFEQTVSPGYSVLALALLAGYGVSRQGVRFWRLAALVFFILSLGPFLHIDGRHVFPLEGRTFSLPLPYLLLHVLPLVGGARVASRFNVMLMLCLAVLVGYGVRYGWGQWATRRWPGVGGHVLAGLAVAVILFEYLGVPLPTLDAAIPPVYTAIAADTKPSGSLLDIPLDAAIAKYQYYQTAHRKRLLTGFGPRPSPALSAYLKALPLSAFFRNPEGLAPPNPWRDPQEAMWYLDLFDIEAIVMHYAYLKPESIGAVRRFLLESFPIRRSLDDGQRLVLWMDRHAPRPLAREPAEYRLDFDDGEPWQLMADGWHEPERWGETTVAWSRGEAKVWLALPRPGSLTMEFKVFPFICPACPAQTMEVFVNGRFLAALQLATSEWRTYRFALPEAALRPGLNEVRWVFAHAVAPADVLPGSRDSRLIAVAFDYLRFRRD